MYNDTYSHSHLVPACHPGGVSANFILSTHAVLQQQISVLYQDHHGWLLHWLHRKLGDRSCAQDIAHDTFARVWTRSGREGLEQLAEPRAYLTTIARRLAVNYFERQALERHYLDTLASLPEAVAPSPEERALHLEALHELDALLDQLPSKARAAFLMSQLDGMSYELIAVQLEVSVRTVTRYMAQGFRQCLTLILARNA